MKNYDCIIIGGGISGLTAGIYTSRAGLRTLILSGEPLSNTELPGGQLMLTPEIENYPGYMGSGMELIEKVENQATQFGSEIKYEQALTFDFNAPMKTVRTEEDEYSAPAVIIATGAIAKRLNVKNEDEFFGRGVSVCATCDGAFFAGQDVAIIGGGHVAVEDALYLSDLANKVYFIHRRNDFKSSSPQSRVLETKENIEFLWEEEVHEILADDKVKGVQLKSGKTVDASGIFIAIGHNPATEKFTDILQLTDNSFIRVEQGSSLTNIEGVFAAGDVVDDKYRQAITAAGLGCIAGLDAQRYLTSKELNTQ